MRISFLLEIHSIGTEVKKIARKYLKWINAPIWVKVGRNVKNIRRWKGLTQETVALRSAIDLKTFKRIERGLVRDITIEQAFRIILALKCSPDAIVPMISEIYLKPRYILG